MSQSCGAALIELLQARGVELVFGIPGVHTLELYRGLESSSIRHVTPRHEQGAAFMADGYARATRRPGVCLLITGAGVTNAATAVASAYHDSQPLLVISSATHSRDAGRGRGPLHDLPDQQRFMASITAFSETVDTPAEVEAALARAFAVLDGPRPRPVHIGIPIDVLSEPAAPEEAAAAQPVAAGAGASGAPHALALATELLAGARSPMIMLGGGAIDAGSQALALSELTGAPVATTTNGKGAVPESHPAAVGVTVGLEPVYGALRDADVVLAVGTEFSEVDYYYSPGVPEFSGALIRVDVDPAQLTSGREPAVGIVGDASEALGELARRLGGRGDARGDRADAAAQRAAAMRAGVQWWDGADRFFGVLDTIGAALPDDAIVCADSTQLAYVANSYLLTERPRSYLAPAGFGTLGPALPMAIGAQLGAPQRAVVCLIGDGGLLFTIPELATAVTEQLPVVLLVWDNQGYGEIRDSMDHAHVAHIGTETTAHDLVAIARGFGCHGERVGALGELPAAITAALERSGPSVLVLPAELAGPAA